jgi:HTH-type transcriptional regulator, global nitrogen regulator NrpRI
MEKKDRNRAAILGALSRLHVPTSSSGLTQFLTAAGHNLSERTVRLYLHQLHGEGLTVSHGKRRTITEKGLAELRAARTLQRVGYLSARIDQMTFSMTFDLAARTGLVVVNVSTVDPRHLAACTDEIRKVFARGYAMGHLLAVLPPGESLGDWVVPEDRLGVCTVCSITLNGVLLKHGVPTTSRLGGLLELRDGRPTRFVEMIHYDGTSIDPLEVFIRSGMTNYCGAVEDGNGLIGASFREMPESSRDLAVCLADRLSAIGLGGFLEIGWPDQPVLGLPVCPGRIGVVMIGGLNPMAVLEERGHRVLSRALAGLLEYNRLFHYDDLPKVLAQYL